MAAIERWEPFREAMTLRETINRLFDEALVRPDVERVSTFSNSPLLDVYETDKAVKVDVQLPGVKPEEVEITVDGAMLTVKGERNKQDEITDDKYMRREIRHSAFVRSVTLPEVADTAHAEATFADGILTVSFPKNAAKEPKRIAIQPQTAKTVGS